MTNPEKNEKICKICNNTQYIQNQDRNYYEAIGAMARDLSSRGTRTGNRRFHHQDERFYDPEQRFRVSIFYPMFDIILSQLENKFGGMKDVLDDYRILELQFLTHSLLKLAREQNTD